jgi:hypothetical protein
VDERIVNNTHIYVQPCADGLQASSLEADSALRPRSISLGTADHYAIIMWGSNFLVGYADLGIVQLRTPSGEVLEVRNCYAW